MLDSFTSNWQNALFNEYSITSVQMMCGVNMFSCLLTAMSLFQQSSFTTSLTFMVKVPILFCLLSKTSKLWKIVVYFQLPAFNEYYFLLFQYPRFIIDCLLISVCSATGQLYIFYTISKFGAVTFVIIMTIRQVRILRFVYIYSFLIYCFFLRFKF